MKIHWRLAFTALTKNTSVLSWYKTLIQFTDYLTMRNKSKLCRKQKQLEKGLSKLCYAMIHSSLRSQQHQAPELEWQAVVSRVLSTPKPSFQANSHLFTLDLACTSKAKALDPHPTNSITTRWKKNGFLSNYFWKHTST